jgi:hypothetical protein
MNVDIRQLATWQVEIYWLHDAERFDELADSASNIFVALGHPDAVAKVIGRYISRAYRLADQAEIAIQAGDPSEERERYRQAAEILQKAGSLLGLQLGVAESQVNWWHRYRHKKKLAVALHILLQHMHHIRLRGIFFLPIIAIVMLRIGRAHDRRDHGGAIAAAKRYWFLLLRVYVDRPIPYLG